MHFIFRKGLRLGIRSRLYGFILVLALSLQAGISTQAAEFTVTDTSAVLYTAIPIGCYPEPDASVMPAAVLDAGTPVQVTGMTSNGWFRVEAGGIFYIPADALTQNPVESITPAPAPQYSDTAEYTVTSFDNALAARTDALSRHASTVLIHNQGMDIDSLVGIFGGVLYDPVCDYSSANIYGVRIRGLEDNFVVTYQYLSTIEEEIYTDTAVAQLFPQFNTGSTYDKVLAVHDYICNTVSYSYETIEEEADFRSAYDALYYNTTVCTGYALLFQKFMDYMGIPCYVASGTVDGVGHAWNLVNIDGQWYHLDCTNDDQDYWISRKHFLKGAAYAGATWGNLTISPTDYLQRQTG
ncbi:MAG: hypothetical protein NC337_06145 [Roseburia sp.]|nr:hypothetical protein [Roseburia sp.]